MDDAGLRVLHVAEAFGGGVYEMVRTLARGLTARGHRTAVAYGIRPETPPDVEGTLHSSIEAFAMPWTQRSVGAQLSSFRALRRLVAEWDPDVVHLHSSFAGVVGSAAVATRVPTVYTPHGYAFDGAGPAVVKRTFRGLERAVAGRVAAVGAVSPSEAELAAGLGSARRIVTVANGIPELDAVDRESPRISGPPRVVAFGRVMAQRQPGQAAEILGELKDLATVEWIGGGRSDDRRHLAALAEAGIPVTGWLPRAEALRRLSDAMVYVHWTAWDGLPLSVLEAAARDVVVVASDIPANRDVLGPDRTFASTRDAAVFVRRVIEDPDFREDVVHDQRERLRPYGAEAMVEGWLSVYRSL